MDDNNRQYRHRGDSAAAARWEEILEVAWRPAWSMRSRKGCLAPFAAWWQRRRVGDDDGGQPGTNTGGMNR